jgi:formylglycine-generating enzyme required for sulfatase activity
MRKWLSIPIGLGLLALIGLLVWTLADLPSPGLMLRYGYPPEMGPTGEVREIQGVRFVEISPGYFRMGSHHTCEPGDLLGRLSERVKLPLGNPPKHRQECPVRWVEIPEGFWIATTEITCAQFARFDPAHPKSHFVTYREANDAMAMVDLEMAEAYCAWLSEKEGIKARLPSETEWECACRAGTASAYSFGSNPARLEVYAWSDQRRLAQKVAKKQPNPWGLFDMHGNLWEWCTDDWVPGYRGAPTDGSARVEVPPELPGVTDFRVVRGGFRAHDVAGTCRSAFRWRSPAGLKSPDIGFRPVFTGEAPPRGAGR